MCVCLCVLLLVYCNRVLKMPDMEEVMPSRIRNSIFCYTNCTFEELTHDATDTCEDMCKFLCKQLNIAPVVQLLFGLRIACKNIWLAGCRQLSNGERYEFRIRFKVSLNLILNNHSIT